MTTFALSLILLSALFHATWNLFAKRSSGGAPFVWLFDVGSVLLYAPLALWFWATQPISLGWVELAAILISSVLHLAYFLSLQRGYRVGDLSLVYPLARGTGPLFSVLLAVLVLGERPTPQAFLGSVLVVFSVFIFAGGGTVLRSGDGVRRALRFGLITGVFIALVLSALVFTPVSYVAPVREVSILVGTLLGARFLGEGSLLRRLVAAAVMVLGVVLLAFG